MWLIGICKYRKAKVIKTIPTYINYTKKLYYHINENEAKNITINRCVSETLFELEITSGYEFEWKYKENLNKREQLQAYQYWSEKIIKYERLNFYCKQIRSLIPEPECTERKPSLRLVKKSKKIDSMEECKKLARHGTRYEKDEDTFIDPINHP